LTFSRPIPLSFFFRFESPYVLLYKGYGVVPVMPLSSGTICAIYLNT